MSCEAIIEDFENGTSFNLRQRFIVPKRRHCTRRATARVGHRCFCTKHAQLAVEGLIQEDGEVATRSVISAVRRFPKKFPGGLYSWAKGLTAQPIGRKS
jgi:hypothetical protein